MRGCIADIFKQRLLEKAGHEFVGAGSKFVSKVLHGFTVNLGYPGLGFANGPGYTQHSPFLEVVKNHDVCLVGLKLGDQHAKFAL
jgi:hypothetical protein